MLTPDTYYTRLGITLGINYSSVILRPKTCAEVEDSNHPVIINGSEATFCRLKIAHPNHIMLKRSPN